MNLYTDTPDTLNMNLHTDTADTDSLNMYLYTDTADTRGFIKHGPIHRYSRYSGIY